ncbi:MAG TPA: thiamine pyrophosphate-dependent enzyme [Chloroflexota bacterium]|nr:thiamine pyrophosphate-dependent enzyme [Chloroflexota bacterium]
MERYECLQAIAPLLREALVVSCIGGTRTEWSTLAANPDFTVHAMGLTSSAALGLALALPDRQVVALDGDGGLLMNLSTLTTIGAMQPSNLLHIVFDNGSYESSGKGPTHTTRGTDLVAVARACSYPHTAWAESVEAFRGLVEAALGRRALALVAAKVIASTANVPNTPYDNVEQKYRFARYVEASSGVEVLRIAPPAHTIEPPAR